MIVRCPVCYSRYDDAECWTICPHGPLWAPARTYCKKHDLVNCAICATPAAKPIREMHLVRQAILNAIPDTIVRDGVRLATEPILRTMLYAAPELHSELWEEFTTAILSVFSRPVNRGTAQTCWGEIVAAILRAELDYRHYL